MSDKMPTTAFMKALLADTFCITDRLFCPHCGLGFTLGNDYIEHVRCHVPDKTTEEAPCKP